MKPLLKWPGGKRRIADQIGDMVVAKLGDNSRYVELFAGGAAVFFHIEPKRAVLVDSCKPLIAFYEAIKREPKAFFGELERILDLPFEEGTYQKFKQEWNGRDFGVRFAARLLYLNRTGFNGLFRLNENLEYNVAWGKKDKLPAFPTLDEILAVSDLLKTTTLYCRDYSWILRATHAGDVVYCDPPYWGTYDRYGGSEFTNADQAKLSRLLERAAKRGVNLFASNIDCQEIRSLYSWATIETVPVHHKISCTNDGRKMVDEVIVSSTAPYSDPRQLGMKFEADHGRPSEV